jgi:hypothetical protein
VITRTVGAAGSPRLGAGGCLAVGLLVLSGCTSGPTDDPGAFSGPWAEEIAYYDAAAESEFAHRAFADSTLSDAEVEEGRSLIAQCYVDHGATVEYDAYGFETVEVVTGSEDPMDVMGTCAFADGGVAVLADKIRLNPDNLDPFTIQAACMVEHGIVEPGFTARDLENSYEEGAALPWDTTDQQTATTCQVDPLGLAAEPTSPGPATP